jgi:hypothetical protein
MALGSGHQRPVPESVFGPPAKLRPGYANFAINDPPLKLVRTRQPVSPGVDVGHRIGEYCRRCGLG